MPEAGPHNQDYLDHHPNAITDRDKAEFIANATKKSEENIADTTERILEGAVNEGDPSHRGDGGRYDFSYEGNRDEALRKVESKRRSTDERAEKLSEVYDKVEKLRGGGK